MLTQTLSKTGLTEALSRPRPVVKLQTFVYREQSSHGFAVEGFSAPLGIDPAHFWLACLEALDEREMVEEIDELHALIALCRPTLVPQSDLGRTVETVCRGHLTQARQAMGALSKGVRLTLAWNIDAIYVRAADGQYGYFWHTSE